VRWLGTAALATLLIVGCGGRDGTADYSKEASATCNWARQSVEVLPERTPNLLKSAAEHLRGLEVPADQRATAGSLAATLGHLSRRAGELSSELDADNPDPTRMRRLRAEIQDDQQEIATTARTLDVSGCSAITDVLLRDRAFAEASKRPSRAAKRLSRAAYRARLRAGLGDVAQRSSRVQAEIRSGTVSSSMLTNYGAFVGAAVERLKPLRPPVRVAPAHRDLVAGLRALRSVITHMGQGLRASGTQQAIQILERFNSSQTFKNLTAAIATLSRRGYLPR
jgi:hypothetical protein